MSLSLQFFFFGVGDKKRTFLGDGGYPPEIWQQKKQVAIPKGKANLPVNDASLNDLIPLKTRAVAQKERQTSPNHQLNSK